ncbi:MAG: hypothetical protein ACFWT7_08240 [Succiniclasticum sp.]|jgi:hypothetical protein
MWKQGMLALGTVLLLQAPFQTAQAQVLATVQADVTGSRALETVELQGDPLTDGNDYYRNLLMVVRNEKGDMLGAWNPDLNGGYDCVLQAVPAGGTGKGQKGRDRILLLAGRTQSGGAVDGRIVNWTNPKKPVVEFTGVDSLGVTASAEYKAPYSYEVTLRTGTPDNGTTLQFSGMARNVLGVFDKQGQVVRPYLRPVVTPVTSLSAWLGQLFTTQEVRSADKQDVLGSIQTRWSKVNGSWQPVDVQWRSSSVSDSRKESGEKTAAAKKEEARVPSATAAWRLYDQKAWVGTREISWPVVAISGEPERQNVVNEVLQSWLHEGEADWERAYQVKFAGKNLLSLEAGRREADGTVVRRLFNFDMRTGREVSLADAFDTKNPDFLRVLNLMGLPQNAFGSRIPSYWYCLGGRQAQFQSAVLDKNLQDEEAIAFTVAALEDLTNFMKDKTLFLP